MIQWLKTSDIRPNPADNPNITVAVPVEANSYVKPYEEAKFSYVLCAGGEQTKGVWKSLAAESSSWGPDNIYHGSGFHTHWFRGTEGPISAQDFQYWCNFDPAEIPWFDRSAEPILFANPTENEEINQKLMESAAAVLVMVPAENRVTGGDLLEMFDDPIELFVSEKSGTTLALDIIYLNIPAPVSIYGSEGEDSYVATD
jgi:hypothetical protein